MSQWTYLFLTVCFPAAITWPDGPGMNELNPVLALSPVMDGSQKHIALCNSGGIN